MSRFILTLLSWAHALPACPDLAGRYVCTYKDPRAANQSSREGLTVTETRDAAGVVTYVYNDSTLITDAAPRELPDDSEMKQQRLRAWCADDGTLRGELRARYYDAGNYAGELKLDFIYSRVGANVRQVTEGQLIGSTGALPLSSSVTCEPRTP